MYKTIIQFLLSIIMISACAGIPRFTSEEKLEQVPKQTEFNNTKEPSAVKTDSLQMVEVGIASYYAHEFHKKMTANGEIYNMYDLSAAHPTLPLNTIIRVTNLGNKKTVVLKINDRMPQHPDRIIDLSYGTAKELDMLDKGLQQVKIEVLVMGDNKRVN
ncbi:MAG: septal ring lytic transglycosylase RlpA family protein [Melioribacteraceae bacterium]|nr:septal ring lytic transglycosylase RlpA family protein [Melioribacteraceae bacterium]